MIEDKLNAEQQEELVAVIQHRGMRLVLQMMEESIDLMRNDVLTVPLPSDPQAAAIAVYAKRCNAEGGMTLHRALEARLKKVVLLYKEALNDRSREKS